MYLLDTNIILEFLLDRARADEVERLLLGMEAEQLYLSDFTLHSLGVILLRFGAQHAFLRVVEDLLLMGGIRLIRLDVAEMPTVAQIAQQFHLDFDDAYQYALAERYDLIILSFDHDFDRTARGRQTPADILQ